MSDSVEESVDDKPITSNLGQYFDSSTPTIFDEIVAPVSNEIAFSKILPSSLKTSMPDNEANNFFSGDTNAENIFSEQKTVQDSHRDAWIPSSNTKKILCTIATSPNGSHQVDKENLTMPGLALANDMNDPIRELANHFLGEEESVNRTITTLSDVTQDERGLRTLIKEGCYRAAINLSGRLLAIYGQGYGKINNPSKHTPHSLQLWFTRLALLTKLRQTDILELESAPFGNLDKPDMYFIFYPELYGTRPGSMASFSFRLLLAEIPMYCGKAQRTLDNLFSILAVIKKIVKNLENELMEDGSMSKLSNDEKTKALQLWKARKSRTLMSITNCALIMKNYILASDLIEQLYKSNEWRQEQLEILKSALGRIYLILGDVSAAEKKFVEIYGNNFSNPQGVRELIDKALISISQNAFPDALKYFKAASEIDKSSIMLINDIAVCLLYTGKLESAVQLLENLITVTNPVKSLQEVVLLNMCTLYELHTTHSKQFKIQLLRQLNQFNGDALNVQCLKLVV